MKDQLMTARDTELLAIINIALMSQKTLSPKEDKEHWRNLANCSLEILRERGFKPTRGKDNLYTL
jgi:hypothetical protein